MTTVSDRLTTHLVKINGRPCKKCTANHAAICQHSKRQIVPGDLIYRPLHNKIGREARWLASEIEAIEWGMKPKRREP